MPDRKPADLTRTAVEKDTGMVDPYAEAMRAALAQGVSPKPKDRQRARELEEETRKFNADHGDYM